MKECQSSFILDFVLTYKNTMVTYHICIHNLMFPKLLYIFRMSHTLIPSS